jgi:hypothetical protein
LRTSRRSWSQRRLYRDGISGLGVRHGERQGMQPQPLRVQLLSPPSIVCALAMCGVSDDGMRQMFEMPTNLVAPTRVRHGLHQGHACARIAVDRNVQMQDCQALEIGLGG